MFFLRSCCFYKVYLYFCDDFSAFDEGTAGRGEGENRRTSISNDRLRSMQGKGSEAKGVEKGYDVFDE